MSITNLDELQKKREQKEREMFEAIAVYRDTIKDESTSRDEIKEACNAAIRRAGELITLQTETINTLVMAGQLLSEAATGKAPKPKS